MPTTLEKEKKIKQDIQQANPQQAEKPSKREDRTLVGWQGIRCALPPDWSLTGFSMDRENGYLRIDAPSSSNLTVQIRWRNMSKPEQPTLYHFFAPKIRKFRKLPPISVPKPNLTANLEKLLKETGKQSKKAKASFESSVKPEKTEGENGERTSINFSWIGEGRGQGKIWYCETCHRMVITQIIGKSKEQAQIASIASQLFASLEDHGHEGFDMWALYDLQMELPDDFQLESQKLLSGYLNLTFVRGSERIVVDRWGLANITRKKFTLQEWFQNHTLIGLKKQKRVEEKIENQEVIRYDGSLPFFARIKAFRDAKLSVRRFPTRYSGGIWENIEENKIYAVQMLLNKKSKDLWSEVVKRCVSR